MTWERFKLQQQAFEGLPNVRLGYYQGEVESWVVSPEHGYIGEHLGLLLTLWMLEQGLEFVSTGDYTVENEGVASAQGDKSYCFGAVVKTRPDLSVEVVISGEGETKLRRYTALGVPEVWFWEDEEINIH